MNAADILRGRVLLECTPSALDAWLRGLPDEWLDCNEGPGTWSPRTIVGHLIEGERSDWMPRVHHLLRHADRVVFPPFDRFAQDRAVPRPIAEQLDEFALRRSESLVDFDALALVAEDLARLGRHPEFGVVTLGQHLATWVAHDLSHVAQIARVMARRHAEAIGPWRAYLPLVEGRST